MSVDGNKIFLNEVSCKNCKSAYFVVEVSKQLYCSKLCKEIQGGNKGVFNRHRSKKIK